MSSKSTLPPPPPVAADDGSAENDNNTGKNSGADTAMNLDTEADLQNSPGATKPQFSIFLPFGIPSESEDQNSSGQNHVVANGNQSNDGTHVTATPGKSGGNEETSTPAQAKPAEPNSEGKKTPKSGVAYACAACSRMKMRCDGNRPCSRCARVNRACEDRKTSSGARTARTPSSQKKGNADSRSPAAKADPNSTDLPPPPPPQEQGNDDDAPNEGDEDTDKVSKKTKKQGTVPDGSTVSENDNGASGNVPALKAFAVLLEDSTSGVKMQEGKLGSNESENENSNSALNQGLRNSTPRSRSHSRSRNSTARIVQFPSTGISGDKHLQSSQYTDQFVDLYLKRDFPKIQTMIASGEIKGSDVLPNPYCCTALNFVLDRQLENDLTMEQTEVIAKLFLEHGANLNASSNTAAKTLGKVVDTGSTSLLQTFIRKGVGLTSPVGNICLQTVLADIVEDRTVHNASEWIEKKIEGEKFFINDTTMFTTQPDSPTCLQLCLRTKSLDCLKRLLSRGMLPDLQFNVFKEKERPASIAYDIQVAVDIGFEESVDLLIQYGALLPPGFDDSQIQKEPHPEELEDAIKVWRSPEVMGDLALLPEHAREVLVKHFEAVKSGEADGVSKPARRKGSLVAGTQVEILQGGKWVRGEVVDSKDGGSTYELRILASDPPTLVTLDSSCVRVKDRK
ncbi:hypothetical protein GUITHDRAFT_144113 [Guillardia theta CCMP2712]|uniref:Zn(2)-C6 fungal-type domain-containing protein n=1 Tax=Guillardia theta (strain CCMP2712) TaxID=905079 RepID=L1IQY5_GUITC|nr:hypothetical protein GUITHDRAFT_144113 [Guillardia theta CCMP2712]EKX38502.1 hypothetical protein GUITHDRAFT_144113 [Guillardia theta CCMP2712]|eukprot:XP_005825482.1 hypothetical protein GUITHDRAFT_144113 [Guillardia theta CCMP2712]